MKPEIEIKTEDIIDTMYLGGKIIRYDIIFNYIGIENHYLKNDYGWSYYEKFYKSSGYDPCQWEKKFIELIDSFDKNGNMTKKYPICMSLDRTRRIRDGSHRFSCVLYFNYPSIFAYVRDCPKRKNFDERSLRKRGFSGHEIRVLKYKALQILERFI